MSRITLLPRCQVVNSDSESLAQGCRSATWLQNASLKLCTLSLHLFSTLCWLLSRPTSSLEGLGKSGISLFSW